MKVYKTFEPEVSIILPTYNRANLISRAISSVINQTFDKWELVIIDDGSTDNTFEVVNRFLELHQNIKYLKHSNRRPPLSFNAGILAAAGKYVTFLGSDDEYKNNHVQLRVKTFESNEVDFIYGGVEIIGNPFVKDKNDLTKEIHIAECVVGGTFFAPKEIFIEMGGFKDIYYSEDSEFFDRLTQRKYKIMKVDFPTYIYHRDTPDSICNNI
ncbi:glycosyltransferase family 2 protein [Melioribacteraceae bacterium 4301-Me]|uniref:glycosyltransferase family 2 protein n=1 Tax=Pyranulibacter aquaticus TaxID=3163344 RepID=UPI003594F610